MHIKLQTIFSFLYNKNYVITFQHILGKFEVEKGLFYN